MKHALGRCFDRLWAVFGIDARNAGDPALGVPIQADWGGGDRGETAEDREKKRELLSKVLWIETEGYSLVYYVYTELTGLIWSIAT